MRGLVVIGLAGRSGVGDGPLANPFIGDNFDEFLPHLLLHLTGDVVGQQLYGGVGVDHFHLGGRHGELAKAHLGEHHLGFKYVAPQGLFQLAMPAAEVEMIDTDTTIELLAHYIAREVKKQVGEKFVKIVAYEGVGKGAIAYA